MIYTLLIQDIEPNEVFNAFEELMNQREKVLLEEGIYKNQEEFSSYKNFFSNVKKFYDQKNHLNISNNLINEKLHTIELSNWLNYIKSC